MKVKIKEYNFNKSEVIIVSIIVGTLAFIIIGYLFGETHYFSVEGNRVSSNYGSAKYQDFDFNYKLGIAGFIITSGLTYLRLNKNTSK